MLILRFRDAFRCSCLAKRHRLDVVAVVPTLHPPFAVFSKQLQYQPALISFVKLPQRCAARHFRFGAETGVVVNVEQELPSRLRFGDFQRVLLIQGFAGSGELLWTASASRVSQSGGIGQCLPFRYRSSAHTQVLQRSCWNWRRSLRIPSLQLLWSAQAETRVLR